MNFEKMVKMSQKTLKTAVAAELTALGYEVESAKGFLYAPGDVPVLLVAHLDTVHRRRVKNIFYSKSKRRMTSPEGIGGDDRCGVYIILEVLKKHKCHVAFCEDEEIGCVGARALAATGFKPEVNYLVELDRRGKNDAVFYQCDNPEFTKFICDQGFEHKYGSFSDIAALAPSFGLAAVNISAGYFNEHTTKEFVDLEIMKSMISRISSMVQIPTKRFPFIEKQYFRDRKAYSSQTSFGGWDSDKKESSEIKKMLMPLHKTSYVNINGQRVLNNGSYYLDADLVVYDYLADLDAAVVSENTTAYKASGVRQKFIKADAIEVNIIPLENAVALLDCIS